MHRLLITFLILGYVAGCTPKLATKGTVVDYTEDVSTFRPKAEVTLSETVEQNITVSEKGPYIAPTHDINREMSTIMDSIIVHNKDKVYLTYTIQVYTGRSREEANQTREKVYRVLPEEKPMLSYKQPSYKVNVGKFIDRVEAYKTLTTLRKTFPGATMVEERNYMD